MNKLKGVQKRKIFFNLKKYGQDWYFFYKPMGDIAQHRVNSPNNRINPSTQKRVKEQRFDPLLPNSIIANETNKGNIYYTWHKKCSPYFRELKSLNMKK